MLYNSPMDYVDTQLVRKKATELDSGFPEFISGCLREACMSWSTADAPLLLIRKVSHLSFLSHMFIRFNNLDRILDHYSELLRVLSAVEVVSDYDYEKLFEKSETTLLNLLSETQDSFFKRSVQELSSLEHKENYKCEVCSKPFKNMLFLKKHMRAHNDSSSDYEPGGDKKNEEDSEQVFPLGTKEDQEDICFEISHDDPYQDLKCDACEGLFDDDIDLKKHVKSCKIVDPLFMPTSHVRMDPEKSNITDIDYQIQCDQCDVKVRSEKALRMHMKGHLKFDCESCGECFLTSRQLASHMRTCRVEDPVGPHMCSLCGKYYKNFAFHMYKTHSGRLYQCNQCDFKTSLNCNLNKHILQVHEGRTQTCDMCGKVVKELKHHKARGCPFRNKKPRHQCDHCEKSFVMKDGLNRHIRAVHFKLKDKSCPHCSYTSAESFNLRLHIARIHEGRKVGIVCPFCSKSVVSLHWHLEQYHKTQDFSAFLDEEMDKEDDKEDISRTTEASGYWR